MTEYDFSPEAYDRYIHTQNRVANWVQHTEQHRPTFEAAAPGAPGVPPLPRRRSPPVPERYIPSHRPSPAYPKPPIYHRAPLSASSSETSYVHVPPPQLRRPRPPPPPIYAPPVPPHAPFPVLARMVDGGRLSPSSPRRRHHRSVSHSHPRRAPPLVTPIYTSPAASPFVPPPPILYMSPRGYPTPPNTRPIISPREQYPTPSSPRTHNRPFDQPPTPPASPSESSSASSADAPTSAYHSSPISPASLSYPPSPGPEPRSAGPGRSHTQVHPPLHPEDQNQNRSQYQKQHRRHPGTNVFPGLEPPYISRNLQYQQPTNNSQHYDYHQHLHPQPYHGQSRSSISNSHSNSQARHSPLTLRPLPYTRHSNHSYHRQPNSSTGGVISIAVPPRYPIDDRDLAYDQPGAISSHARTKLLAPLVLHAPQPIRHPDMLSPKLHASTRAQF